MQVQQRIELSPRPAQCLEHPAASPRGASACSRAKGAWPARQRGHLDNLRMQLEEKQQALEEQTLLQEEAASAPGSRRAGTPRRACPVQQSNPPPTPAGSAPVGPEAAAGARANPGQGPPWLRKHELDTLPRLWQKVQVEEGWETALESVLRDAPARWNCRTSTGPRLLSAMRRRPAWRCMRRRRARRRPSTMAGLKSFASLLKLNDPGLRGVLNDWLHLVFAAETATGLRRARAPAAGRLLRHAAGPCGHASSVRFYAADAEQDGMLARQHEIDNIGKQLRAQALLLDEARTRATRADAAVTELHAPPAGCARRIATLQREVHALQIEVVRQNEVEARFNQRSGQIDVDLDEIAAQEEEQRQADGSRAAVRRARHGAGRAAGQRTRMARPCSCSRNAPGRSARQAARTRTRRPGSAVRRKDQRARIEELRRSIATATQQAAQVAWRAWRRQGRTGSAGKRHRGRGPAGTAARRTARKKRCPTRATNSTR
jgi:chromosome segregation protein